MPRVVHFWSHGTNDNSKLKGDRDGVVVIQTQDHHLEGDLGDSFGQIIKEL